MSDRTPRLARACASDGSRASAPARRSRRVSWRGVGLVGIVAGGMAAAAPAVAQQPPFEGYLCCNMQSDGSWISDINYRYSYMKLVPAGTPVKAKGFGRWRVYVEIGGKSLAIGNDYSRTMSMEEFAHRYIVAEDPTALMQGAPPKVREAVQAAKVTPGMTRAQVLMSIGYPITSYNPSLDAPIWRYWADSSSEFQVFWGSDGRVDRIFGAPEVRAKVAVE